jgi:uncharacterized OB-fold protein
LEPVVPGLFSLPPDNENRPTLLGGFCQGCDRHFFPGPKYCPQCLGQVQRVPLMSNGAIYSYTFVRIKPPLGLPSPYSVVYVDLSEVNLRVFGLFDPNATQDPHIGLEVELDVGPLGVDSNGKSCLRPYFTPRKNHEK